MTAPPQALLEWVLSTGLDGKGPLKGALEVADEHLARHGDTERAITRLVNTHARLVGATGFVTGLGGLLALPVGIPTDVSVFYAMAARCVGAIAHLRGYDIDSDEVRSMVLLSLVGAAGAGVLAQVGVQAGSRTAVSALRQLPGHVWSRSTRGSASACSPSSGRRASSTWPGRCRWWVVAWERASTSSRSAPSPGTHG